MADLAGRAPCEDLTGGITLTLPERSRAHTIRCWRLPRAIMAMVRGRNGTLPRKDLQCVAKARAGGGQGASRVARNYPARWVERAGIAGRCGRAGNRGRYRR